MSEYQYYEFQAVDRPLTQQQMSELRACSSRARITPSSFVNEYQWGNFKGNPDRWMEKYFDTFLYFANWGSRWFMLRLPEKLLNGKVAEAYCGDANFLCRTKDDNVILSFQSDDEDGDWTDEEIRLASLLPVRSDLMRGDHRALYLGWLLAVQSCEVDDDDLEPPVPPGLGDLTAALDSLTEFLRIDCDLIDAAAERSSGKQDAGFSLNDIDAWVLTLPSREKDALLARMIAGAEPHLANELQQRAVQARRGGEKPTDVPRRTAGEISARAEVLAEEREKKEAVNRAREKVLQERERAENRKKHLDSIAGKENDLWAEVNKLIATKQPKRYDEAMSLLRDLHDLADVQGKKAGFSSRMSALYAQHERKPSLVDRFRKAKLVK